jgi:hypothetical protein
MLRDLTCMVTLALSGSAGTATSSGSADWRQTGVDMLWGRHYCVRVVTQSPCWFNASAVL